MNCRRELFDEVNALIAQLESETIGPDGFVPFVERKFFVMPWNSRRVRAARENIPAALARLRELSGLISAEVETRDPDAVYPVREGESLGAYAARVGLPEDSLLRPRSVTVYEPAEIDEAAEHIIDLIEREARDASGAPAVTREAAERYGDHVARAWDRAYAPAARPDGLGWELDGLELQPGAPPAPPPPPPPPPAAPAPAPAPEPDPAPAPPPAPAPDPAPAPAPEPPPPPPAPEPLPAPEPAPAPAPSPSRVLGGSVELIDFGKLTRANEGAWDARISRAPDDMKSPGAFVATSRIVIDFSALPNPKSATKLLARTGEGKGEFDEAAALSPERVRAFIERVAALPSTPLQVIPDELPEPIAFKADGVRWVLFPAVNDPMRRILVRADHFVFVRGYLTGRKLQWSSVVTPKLGGMIARDAKDPTRVLAFVKSADMALDPEQVRTLIAQRMSGAFAKE